MLALFPFTLLHLVSSSSSAPQELKPLRSYLVEIPSGTRQMDLSGLLRLPDDLKARFGLSTSWLVVNDKSSWVYALDFEGRSGSANPKPWLNLATFVKERRFDLEDLATDGEHIYVVHEIDGSIFQITPPSHRPLSASRSPRVSEWTPDLPKSGTYALSSFGGIEGIEFFGDIFFLLKELVPLAIFTAKKRSDASLKIQRTISRSSLGSQTAIRIRNEAVFLLDREGHCVWKMLVKELGNDSQEQCLSFAKTVKSAPFHYPVKDGEGRVRPEWGTAEALEVTESEIWVGLDNNGLGLFSNPKEKRPTVIVFERR